MGYSGIRIRIGIGNGNGNKIGIGIRIGIQRTEKRTKHQKLIKRIAIDNETKERERERKRKRERWLGLGAEVAAGVIVLGVLVSIMSLGSFVTAPAGRSQMSSLRRLRNYTLFSNI